MWKNKLFLLLFCTCLCLLVGCQNEIQKPSPPAEKQQEKNKDPKEIKAHIIDSTGIIENIGWVTNSEVLTVKEEKGKTVFYIYDLYEQKKEKIYQITKPLVKAVISPSRDKLLIHTAPLTYTAEITIVDLKGNELFQKVIPSYELYYSWNPFNSELLAIASFTEDWDFEVFMVDIKKKHMSEMEINEPFLQWKSENGVIYQNWDTNEISFTAPLVAQNIFNGKVEEIEEKSMHFKQFNNKLFTIDIENEGENLFSYRFIGENGKILSSFHFSLLSRYTDWLIPYYDMIESKDKFLTFVANGDGIADSYSGTFSLHICDVKKGEKEILLEDLPNEPIECSPNGESCLYGLQLEKIIDLSNKKVISLLKEGAER